jgi:hypothetical protein
MAAKKYINIRAILQILGLLLIIEAFFMLFCIPFSWYYGSTDFFDWNIEDANHDFWPLVISAAITFISGIILYFGSRKAIREDIGKREGYIIVSIAWVVISLFGALPYILSGSIPNFTNAFFETISGFFVKRYYMKKIKWRKWNRAIHRDLGYFFFAMALIYGLSGIAINHLKDWNPNYIYIKKSIEIGHPIDPNISKSEVLEILKKIDEEDGYKDHRMTNPETLRIFLNGGSAYINIETGSGNIERVKRRPLFHAVNYLHYNPKKWWVWFSDAFAVGLIILAVSGLFILKGKNGITRRGAIITSIGILIPIIFLLLYY